MTWIIHHPIHRPIFGDQAGDDGFDGFAGRLTLETQPRHGAEQPIVMSGRVDRISARDQDYLVDGVGELQPTVFDADGRFAHGKKPTVDISDPSHDTSCLRSEKMIAAAVR